MHKITKLPTLLVAAMLSGLACTGAMAQTAESEAEATAAAAAANRAAEKASAGAKPDPGVAPADRIEMIESARETVRETTWSLARGLDSWFGDRPFEDGGKVRNARLDLSLLKREGEKFEVNLRFNARVRLPNLERLAYVVVGRDDPRELVTDQPGALSNQNKLRSATAQDNTFFAGLGRTFNDVVDVRLGVRGAFKIYAQARAQHEWQISDADTLGLRQTFFWTLDDRFGSTTAASLQHDFSPRLAVRWIGAATVTQELPKFVWASNLGVYQSFGAQRLLSLEAVSNGRQSSGVSVLDYGLQAGWEQPVYRQWLLGSVLFGRFWPRPEALAVRKGTWAFGVGLKMRL